MADQEVTKEEKKTFASREEEILEFWKENHIFEKSLQKESPKGEFIFYDGPPFATGLPHYGHILAGSIKDVIPRFKTMQGFYVPRQWGWDCHGLPVENLVEKELGLGTKKDIVRYGVEAFNQKAKESVMRFADDWRRIIPRLGRFVDMENDYRTMDTSYTESVWWAFKKLHEKGLIFEGFKSMHLCPRCETTLSNFEVNQGYKDITDISVYAKFKLVEDTPASSAHAKSDTYMLAWTTTPWTLPGNAALAVHPEVIYVKIKSKDVFYILAKERLTVCKEPYEVVGEVAGKELIGLSYIPPFSYYTASEDLKHKEKGWKVYGADFVTTTDGTGIVHIAPAFGDDDYNLAKREGIPFIQHVTTSGVFTPEVTDFAGQAVKPKDDHQAGDVLIIKELAHRGLLFAKEKLVHSYPHCWRCDTPLLNYASSSWFVEVTKMRDDLVTANKTVSWIPEDIKEGRFGKWLEGARDWSISRSRFWGAPIPVWKCDACHHEHIVGSLEELRQLEQKTITKVILLRHGESEKNIAQVFDSSDETYPLTEKGRKQAKEAAAHLGAFGVDLIYTSPVRRARETAEIVGEKLGLVPMICEAVREVHNGQWEGKHVDDPQIAQERHAYNEQSLEGYYESKRGKTGESWQDVEKRMCGAVQELIQKHPGKTILIVSHQGPLAYLMRGLEGLSLQDTGKQYNNGYVERYAKPQVIYSDAIRGGAFDLHRPFIDTVVWECECGGVMRRVPEVFDCWFESGSMPFASKHYPFENLEHFDPEKHFLKKAVGYPADFIAEGLDQTRGWFYSMLVLSVGLFGKSAFKNVVVNGTVLAEDGQKMSKRLKNYPDPMEVVSKYGADALRFYLLSSPVVRAQDVAFSEKGVDEAVKKILTRLDNVRSFYKLYEVADVDPSDTSTVLLDRWMISRLHEMGEQMTEALERYELDRAARPIGLFVDDLSTWYLRRSRDRFKGTHGEDKKMALQSLRFVLLTLSAYLAPWMPFYAEYLYREMKTRTGKESVHLEAWPKREKIEHTLHAKMDAVRAIVSLGLESRARAGIKVRQPLRQLAIRAELLSDGAPELIDLIKDEVNVKEVSFVPGLASDVELDTVLTPLLREEGIMRDCIRAIQELRKEANLSPRQSVELLVETSADGKELLSKYENEIAKVTGLTHIVFTSVDGLAHTIEGITFTFALKR